MVAKRAGEEGSEGGVEMAVRNLRSPDPLEIEREEEEEECNMEYGCGRERRSGAKGGSESCDFEMALSLPRSPADLSIFLT